MPSVAPEASVKAPAPDTKGVAPQSNVPFTVAVREVATGKLLASVNEAPEFTAQLIFVLVNVPEL